jgi:hypothetical protein
MKYIKSNSDTVISMKKYKKRSPYLSIIISGRNDNHGGEKIFREKHETFIKYFKKYLDVSEDYLEVIIVDYNQVEDKKSFFEQFNWNNFRNVKNLVITRENHKIITQDSKYPFHGNIAFNEALKIATGEFVVYLSIETRLSLSLMRYLRKRILKEDYFYRTDLFYFPEKYFGKPFVQFLWARFTFSNVARRHSSSINTTLDVKPKSFINRFVGIPKSFPNFNEVSKKNLFLTKYWPEFPMSGQELNNWLVHSGLHTNASGDFILASRENWIKIGGFSEDPMWQLHNDSMALGEFCKVQMKQVLFRWPLATFQTLHERGGWIGMNQLSWEEWCELFVQVINGKVDVVKRQIKNS